MASAEEMSPFVVFGGRLRKLRRPHRKKANRVMHAMFTMKTIVVPDRDRAAVDWFTLTGNVRNLP